MTSGAPWSVKGIDPKAREVAKDLARRSGMTLGEWLNRMILDEDGPDELTSQAYFAERPALAGRDDAVAEAVARVEGAVEQARAESSRLAERLGRMEAQASGSRSPEALRSLEAALNRVASHLSEGEGRTRDSLRAMETRIDQLTAGGAPNRAVLLDEMAERVEARLNDAESRTSEALVNLGQAFADLDRRVGAAEVGSTPDVEKRIETLSAALSQRVDDLRGEISDAVRRAEQVASDAVERVGRDVMTVADNLNRQVEEAERRSADAIEQVGGEVARIAEAMENRFGRTESAHAEALERLGAEISRITDRLTERIGSSERRSSSAIDEVGDQVSLLSERLAQSEERTARLLEEARAKVDHGLARSRERLEAQAAEAPEALAAMPAAAEGISSRLVQDVPDFGEDPFEELTAEEPEEAPLALQAFAVVDAGEAPEPAGEDAGDAVDLSVEAEDEFKALSNDRPEPDFDVADFEAAEVFGALGAETPEEAAGEAEPIEVEAAVEEDVDAEASAQPQRQLSTREVIEQARAAARAAAAEAKGQKAAGGKLEKLPKREGKSLFPGLPLRKRSSGGSLHTALLVAGGAACLSLGTASYFVMDGEPGGATPQRVADALDVMSSDRAGEVETGEVDTSPVARAAVALAPKMTAAPAIAANAPAARTPGDAAALGDLYARGLSAIEAGDARGVEDLRRAANLGHSPAQFYMAKLYAEGRAGLKKDPAAARRWTERAAEGGNRAAMHNLGIALAEGQGGPTNAVTAAQWFRRAAELGLVDSQFNLGVLYEQGRGVSLNAAEAYKWYLIAARSKDKGALDNAARVRQTLSPEARTVAERAAQAFRPTEPNPSATALAAPMGASPADISRAQQALSVLRYYQGPTDGVSSPALKMAIAAYQREAGLTATGALDTNTLSRLQVFTQ